MIIKGVESKAKSPQYTLSIDGVPLNLQGRLISLRLDDRSGMAVDQLTLEIDDAKGNVNLPRRGVTLDCAFGFSDKLMQRGSYIVDEVEHSGPPDKLSIRARAADFRDSLLEQREASYHELTLGTILMIIANRNQLKLTIAEDYSKLAVPHLDQTNESDANLITRLGRDHDALATIKSGKLLFIHRSTGKSASNQDLQAVLIKRTECEQHRYSIADREARVSGVVAYWQDKPKAERKKVTVGDIGYQRHLRGTYSTESAARNAAEAEWKRLKSGKSELSLTLAEGRTDIYAECPVAVIGFKPEIDANRWIVKEVTHIIGEQGYINHVRLEEIID